MAFNESIEDLIQRNSAGLLGSHPSWERARLGDVADVQNGFAFKSQFFNVEGRGLPLIRIRDVLRGRTETFYDGPFDDAYVVQPGDLIVGMDGDFNHAVWQGPSALLNQRVCRLRFKSPRLTKEFVLHVLGGYLRAVNEATSSITVKHLSSRTIADLLLPAPDLATQAATVEALRSNLQYVDEGVERLHSALEGAQQFRLAVSRDVLAGDWPIVALRDVLSSLRNGISVSRPAPHPPGIPIYRISAVRPMALDLSEIRYAPEDLVRADRYFAEPGDLLFTRYSGNPELVGACALVPEGATPALHPDKLIRGVVNRDIADPRYLELACSTGSTWSQIRASRKTTAGQVGIAGRQLAAVPVPLPPLDVQRSIVSSVQGQFAAAGQMEQAIGRALVEANALRTSLRRDAVHGRFARDGNNGHAVRSGV